MSTVHDKSADTCPECEGRTIEFRGSGKNLQRRLCTRWKEPGHLTEEEVRTRVREEMDRAWPPGAFGLRRQA
jgi:hypothetical protein